MAASSCASLPYAEIEANGFDLNIGRYIKTTSADEIDLDTALADYLRPPARPASPASRPLFERLAAAGIADLGRRR